MPLPFVLALKDTVRLKIFSTSYETEDQIKRNWGWLMQAVIGLGELSAHTENILQEHQPGALNQQHPWVSGFQNGQDSEYKI